MKKYTHRQGLSLSAQVAIRKYLRLGGLNSSHLCHMILEAEKSETKVVADEVLCDVSFLSTDNWIFPVCSQGLSSVPACGERHNSSVSSFSYKGNNPMTKVLVIRHLAGAGGKGEILIINRCLFCMHKSNSLEALTKTRYHEWGIINPILQRKDSPGGASGKKSAHQCRRPKRRGFDPWVANIPWSRKWQCAPVFLPGESHGQRSLVGYSPWGHKESYMTERTLQMKKQNQKVKELIQLF